MITIDAAAERHAGTYIVVEGPSVALGGEECDAAVALAIDGEQN